MQFNSHATNQDIVTYSNTLSKSNDTSFPLVDKVLFANEGQRIILSWIWESYGGWVYDDKNNTDLPDAKTNLISGQAIYALPDVSGIQGFSFKIEGSDSWTKLVPITLEQIQQRQAEPEFERTNATPIYYRLTGNTVKLYPAPDYSQALSLKAELIRDIVSFTTTDTTKTPGFESQFHEAVPTYMALRQAEINNLSMKDDLRRAWSNENRNYPLGYEQRIKKHYSAKFRELFPPRFTTRDYTLDYQ